MTNRVITATPWKRLLWLLTIGFCNGALLTAQGTTPAAPRPVTYPRMSNEVVTQLLDRASFNRSDEVQPGTITAPNEHLTISSARVLIAEKNAQVMDAGGSYTPPTTSRYDVVRIDCGKHTQPDQAFPCTQVIAKDLSGAVIKPLQASSAKKAYRTASGQPWSVYETTSVYPAASMANGFSIRYASPDGSSWDVKVTAADASRRLLLTVGNRPVVPPPAGTDLRLRVRATDTGWEIENTTERHWHQCVFRFPGGQIGRLFELNSRERATLAPSAFSPALPLKTPADNVTGECQDQGRTVTAMMVETPMLRVRIEPSTTGWTIVNLTDAAWTSCSVTADGSEAAIAKLAPNDVSLLTTGAFADRFAAGTTLPNPGIRCAGSGRPSIAIVEQLPPVPAAVVAPKRVAAVKPSRPLKMRVVLNEDESLSSNRTLLVENLTADHWFACSAATAVGRLDVGNIAPKASVALRPSTFVPPLTGELSGSEVVITCQTREGAQVRTTAYALRPF